MHYTIGHTQLPAHPDAGWNDAPWDRAAELAVTHFHPRSSAHRPDTRMKLLYTKQAIHGYFRVQDRYVKSTRTVHNSDVCCDACVEWFFQPRRPGPYFNLEINAGGTMHFSCIRDPRHSPKGGFMDYTLMPVEKAHAVAVHHSAPAVMAEEIREPFAWEIRFLLPLELLESYIGPLGDLSGTVWYGNVYKCAVDNSHPHWASWNPLGEKLNFHQPDYFAPMAFAPAP